MKILLPLWLKKILLIWYQNLKADTPKLAKYFRNTFIGIGSTCTALITGYAALPQRIQDIIPENILLILVCGTAFGIIFSQSFKTKE
jgi:hypothetical protein